MSEGATVFALNFYSALFAEQLRDGRKTATIRLGDKTDKYQSGQIVWLTVGRRFGTRKKVGAAIIDAVDVKSLRDVTPREIQRDNPELRRHEELIEFLSNIYGREREISPEDTVTVIQFSRVDE
ncbi:MAG TPA: ASCH domain-containing protein [bacterium]